ncbi:MAG: inositol-3-phosphate synthase [Deltaproteobacteria bacterium]|nr:MAG: inositol-3-phosphate synthase [Deltaproteobacteria bacterium]
MGKIKVAVAGVGNCASALIQGIEFYRRRGITEGTAEWGLITPLVGPYAPGDIEIVAAFDVDRRKVGKRLAEAIFAPPNCTRRVVDTVDDGGVVVSMSPVLDGVPDHMAAYPDDRRFIPAEREPDDVRRVLSESGAEILVNFLPVGSQKATEYFASLCLDLGIAFANCIPVFIASDPVWGKKFTEKNIPVIGDDVKSQLGATILHRSLVRLFNDRGIRVKRTYQLNTGGNTDFLNMLNRERLSSKKISKTESVRSVLDQTLDDRDIHVGPSDYVPWQDDNKIAFIRVEGEGFCGAPVELEVRLSVIDSPNSAGVVIDVLRCLKLALDAGIGGPLLEPSSYFMKHPPLQFTDEEAREEVRNFIHRAVELAKKVREPEGAREGSTPR